MFDDLTKKLPACTVLLLVGSTTYDYSYLLALDLTFADIPTSIADHVRSALVWAPGIAAVYALGFVAGLASPPLGDDDRIPARHPQRAVDAVFLSLIPLLLLIALFLEWPFLLLAASAIVTGAAFRFGIGATHIDDRLGPGRAKLLLGALALLVLVALIGWSQGRLLLQWPEARVRVTLKAEQGHRVVLASGLRRFSTSAILVSPGRTVEIVPNEALLSAAHLAATSEPLGCFIVQRLCKQSQ